MTTFGAYLQLGFKHITDPNGYDHILFIIALCAVYTIQDWQKVLLLVTAFTIGHSVTLAMATLGVFTYRRDVIEFLIPITIFSTAFGNFFYKPKETSLSEGKTSYLRYIFALCFGFIHGLGFSSFLRSILGEEESLFQPLLAFNVGLEIGQSLIVLLLLTLAYFFHTVLKVKRHSWILIVSGITIGVALTLIRNTWIF
jgi:hypothetical protein